MPQDAPSRSQDPSPGAGAAGLVEPVLLAFLPGLHGGTLLAELLFFLNPELPFSAGALFRGVLYYGGALGLLSTLLLAPFTWRRPDRARRLLPWSITAVLVLAALGCWIHASYFSYFLPPGINVRFIKAASWLTLGALIFFYTALLHTLQDRSYGNRSRIGLVFVALVSVFVMAERREAFEPPSGSSPLPSAVEAAPRPSLLVVGLEGATLDAVLPLAEQGQLPFFARLLEEGIHARLESFPPTDRAALWTSLATGKYPYKHGVFDRHAYPSDFLWPNTHMQLIPRGLGFSFWGTFGLPVEVTDRSFLRSLPLWGALARLGVLPGVVGWPVTYPADREMAFAFSDRFFQEEFTVFSARPRELAERGVLFRVDAQEIDPGLIIDFGDPVPFHVLEILARDLWQQTLATFLIDQRRDARAVFLMLPGLGEVSRLYLGGFSAVHFEGVQGRVHQEAARLLVAYYRQLDRFLEETWERMEGPRLFAVVSAYGFQAPGGARQAWFDLTGRRLRGSANNAPDGVLLLAGEGVVPGGFLDDAGLADVAPTLLYGMGLPIARDLDGRVLTAAFTGPFLARHPLTFVPSYENLATEGSGLNSP